MACGELVKYAEQFGTDNVGGFVLVDGFLLDKPSPELFAGLSGWMNQLQQDRQKQADAFVRGMYKKPQAEDYYKRVMAASSRRRWTGSSSTITTTCDMNPPGTASVPIWCNVVSLA